MKKIFFKMAFVAIFLFIAGYTVYTSLKPEIALSNLAIENVEALADAENPMCLNGCVSGGGGCLCYTWYPTYREYSWR